MNDDQLRAELGRRAEAASDQPDWAKRVLLPAVRHEIDARPQPVVTSRLSPTWRVAAVIAALLFLIVAVPRAFPPSATGSPSPAPVPTASGALPDGQIRLTCDAPVVPGHCLQPVAWAVQHLPSGLAPVAAVAIMYINLCPDTLPRASCIYPPHHDEWWAEFTLRDGSALGMHVSNTMAVDTLESAVLGATPPPNAQPVFGSFTLECGQVDEATCTGAAAGSSDLSPNKPPRTVSVEPFAATTGHYAVTLNFEDGTTAKVEVAPDPQRDNDNGWSSVALIAPSPTIEVTPPPSPTSLACVGEGTRVSVLYPERANVVSCHQLSVDSLPASLLDPGRGLIAFDTTTGDQTTVLLRWYTDTCAPSVTIGANWPFQGHYQFGITRPGGCIVGGGLVIAVELVIDARLTSDSIRFFFDQVHGPSPTPILAARTIGCGPDGSLPMTFVDHSGLLASCTTNTSQPSSNDISVTRTVRNDLRHFTVSWPPNDCGNPAQIEFWGPLTHSEVPDSFPHYVMEVSRLPSSGAPCGGGWGDPPDQAVDLVFNSDMSADDIEAFFNDGDPLGENQTTVNSFSSAESFVLQLGEKNAVWSAGEPIQVTAHVLYLDGQDTVSVVGMFPRFGFEQLDGPLEVPTPAIITSCPQPHVVKQGDDQTTDFFVGHSILGGPDYEEYFKQYGYDDQFRLPPGTYRLYAHLDFDIGDCGGQRVLLDASVVVVVH